MCIWFQRNIEIYLNIWEPNRRRKMFWEKNKNPKKFIAPKNMSVFHMFKTKQIEEMYLPNVYICE